MHIENYTYKLPKSNITMHPPKVRGRSKLLILNKNSRLIRHDRYNNLSKYLNPGDIVVLNNTKVLKARLIVYSKTKKREFFLLERHNKEIDIHHWKILHKGTIKAGEIYTIGSSCLKVDEILKDGTAIISSEDDLIKISELFGEVPLPPYLQRNPNKNDETRYQTEFSKILGSVAAPTASLNFTSELIEELRKKHIYVVYITLHVGLGTFLPIRTNNLLAHKMHSEYFEIPQLTMRTIQNKMPNNKIIAIGTTVSRTLEYAHKQILTKPANDIVGEADIFITPGYKFKVIDMMLTNFHAPKSTVLMMAAAFSGWENLNNAYNIALNNNYKFLSYGDSMLIV